MKNNRKRVDTQPKLQGKHFKNIGYQKIVIVLASILLLLSALVGGYIIYMIVTYHRIADNTVLEVSQTAASKNNIIQCGEEYTALTYNIGFGAYSDDYSFFMDGGKYSRAFSKEAAVKNVTGAAEAAQACNPDFVLFQEVDLDSTRSYHINQYEIIQEYFVDFAANFGVNYHSSYLMVPLNEPHGASTAGLATFSRFSMYSALRRSLPISGGIGKFIDLDRAYVITRLPVENGKELVIFNVHLSAYATDDTIVGQQIAMLSEDMKQDLAAGNYILCGGDYNQDLLGNSPEVFQTAQTDANWAKPFPTQLLPEGMALSYDLLSKEEHDNRKPSCRNADKPYEEGESFVTMVDGFLISNNLELIEINTIDTGFAYSDHNPVMMKFKLKE